MKRDSRQVYTEYLVLQAQGGSDHAFRELFELWSADLVRLARIQLQKQDAVDDVTQNTWVSIAKGLKRLDDPACFPRWAFRILDRRCADWIRKRQTDRRHREVLEQHQSDSQLVENCNDDVTVTLEEAIAQLDSDARKLLHLFYETGLRISEIAEILDLPVGTVKSRLFKLRETLKQHIERTMI